jgi:hypothetical protein
MKEKSEKGLENTFSERTDENFPNLGGKKILG